MCLVWVFFLSMHGAPQPHSLGFNHVLWILLPSEQWGWEYINKLSQHMYACWHGNMISKMWCGARVETDFAHSLGRRESSVHGNIMASWRGGKGWQGTKLDHKQSGLLPSCLFVPFFAVTWVDKMQWLIGSRKKRNRKCGLHLSTV